MTHLPAEGCEGVVPARQAGEDERVAREVGKDHKKWRHDSVGDLRVARQRSETYRQFRPSAKQPNQPVSAK